MLAFMHPQKQASVAMNTRHEDGSGSFEAKPDEMKTAIAEALIAAIHSKNASKLMDALEAAIEHLCSESIGEE